MIVVPAAIVEKSVATAENHAARTALRAAVQLLVSSSSLAPAATPGPGDAID